MKPTVYIETSVFGAYFDDRSDPVSAAQRLWTRQWWTHAPERYRLVTGQPVLDELLHPAYPHSARACALAASVPVVSIVDETANIVQTYIRMKLMPRNPLGDALHVALASYHKCDFLLTWNCAHIANPTKFRRLQIVNTSLGLFVPLLATPNQLLENTNE